MDPAASCGSTVSNSCEFDVSSANNNQMTCADMFEVGQSLINATGDTAHLGGKAVGNAAPYIGITLTVEKYPEDRGKLSTLYHMSADRVLGPG